MLPPLHPLHSAAAPQQLPNPCMADGFQNSMQIPPQNQAPFCNFNHMNMPSPMFQPGLMNGQNHPIPMQNNPPSMPQFGSFVPSAQNMSSVPAFPAQGPFNQMNPGNLPLAQFCGQFPNLVQQLNQNMGFSNGQFCLPYQNMHQHNPMVTSYGGPNQAVPMVLQNQGNPPFGFNQVLHNPQNFIPQTMGANGSSQLPGSAQPMQGNSMPMVPFNSLTQPQQARNLQSPAFTGSQTMGANGSSQLPGSAQQLQGNSMVPFNSLTQPQQARNLQSPAFAGSQTMGANGSSQLPGSAQQLQGNSTMPFNSLTQPQQARNLQSPAFAGSQGNSSINDGGSRPNSCSKNFAPRNFTRNSKNGFQKNQHHHMKNEKKKYGFPGRQKGKGFHNDRENKFGVPSSTNEVKDQKRPPLLIYTEQEIRKWREARRRNYPSSANIQQRLAEKQTNRMVADREARILQQELTEILAKQAELGVEVAEIPSKYLSYSDNSDKTKRHDNKNLLTKDEANDGHQRSEGPLARNEKPQNKFNKRGRHDKKHRSRKKVKSEQLSNTPSLNKREPTLLEKLLKADIKRDKSQLLQALRFMVMNSFFKEWPNKPLLFPSVIIKQNGCEVNVVDEKSMFTGNFSSHGTNNSMVEKLDGADDNANNNGNEDDEDDNSVNVVDKFGGKIAIPEEEEGEIID